MKKSKLCLFIQSIDEIPFWHIMVIVFLLGFIIGAVFQILYMQHLNQ